jgi:hypothetical protein
MPHTNDPGAVTGVAGPDACLRRTRTAVLNVLVGVGLMIAVSGWLLRRRAEDIVRPAPGMHEGLLLSLVLVAVASYLVRRAGLGPLSGVPAGRRGARFFRSHVGSSVIAAIGVPLGLIYGWFVDPRLEGVIPFWVVPLALGFLAIPRRGELDNLGPSRANHEAPSK